jgi:anti-sigma B factor antagonist
LSAFIEVVEVKGTLDNQKGKTLLPAVESLAVKSPSEVILLDLSPLKFIDSAGLGWLVKVLKVTEANGKRLLLCGVRNQVSMLLQLTRMSNLFEIFDDRLAVVAALNKELSPDHQLSVEQFKTTVL